MYLTAPHTQVQLRQQNGNPKSHPGGLRLSTLAVKYSHPVGPEHDDLYGSSELKSGLTPLDLGPFVRRQDVENLHRWMAYQLRRFDGS